MITFLLLNLVITAVAIFLTLNTTEEIVKVAAAFTAILSLFLLLLFVPWPLKLLVLSLPFAGEQVRRFRHLSGELES